MRGSSGAIQTPEGGGDHESKDAREEVVTAILTEVPEEKPKGKWSERKT